MSPAILRPVAAFAALVGLAAYATIMLRGPQGLSALNEKRRQIRMLEEENANLSRDIESKKRRIERLEHDPKTQEVEIEKRLGKLRPGSTEFKIAGAPAPDLSNAASDASALKNASK
ncbi:MAG: FtsB family cell division protein [Bryobacteraceae bacterium]